MKKLLFVFLAFTLVFLFVACADETPESLTSTQEASIKTSETFANEENPQNQPLTQDQTATKENVETKESAPVIPDVTESTAVPKKTEAKKPEHTHSFSIEATCLEGKKCSCGAVSGDALGHEYKNYVCTRCGAEQKIDFVNLKDYYWKYGVESVNLGVPGKEAMAPYALDLWLLNFGHGFLNKSACIAWTEGKDAGSIYNTPNIDPRPRVYNGKVYTMETESYGKFSYEETNTSVIVTFVGGGAITLRKSDTNVLTVESNTSTAFQSVPVGTVFKAHPCWEVFN